MTIPLVGRKAELGLLNQAVAKNDAKLLVLTGRRRVGKSRLIGHFGEMMFNKKHKPFYKLVGMPPQGQNRKSTELNNLATQMADTFNTVKPQLNDWTDALYAIGSYVKAGHCMLLIDEINWFGKTDDHIAGSLFTLWENKLQHLPGFTLVLSGSLASWIEKEFLRSTAWYGRISWEHVLQPLPLADAIKFIPAKIRKRLTPMEQLRYIMVSGGIPSYLLAFNYVKSLEDNLAHNTYSPGGYFFNEYDRLLNDLFRSKGKRIQLILEALNKSKSSAEQIARALGIDKANGHLYGDLDMMIMSGFIEEVTPWDFSNGKKAQRNKQYCISDPYIRFYLKCIKPYRQRILNGDSSLCNNLDSFLGLQFEIVMRQNLTLVYQVLGIKKEQVLNAGSYQTKGLQIDLLIQTRRFFYIVEMKFQLDELDSDVVLSMRQKLDRFSASQTLSIKTALSLKTALIHVSGAKECVHDSEYIDICENVYDHIK